MREVEMATENQFLDLGRSVGAVLGSAAFVWQVVTLLFKYIRDRADFLQMKITISDKTDAFVIIRTEIVNVTMLKKKIDDAMLLIGPASENPVDTANIFMSSHKAREITHINQLNSIHPTAPEYIDHRAWIPLPYYFEENAKVSNEELTCSYPLERSKFEKDNAYSIRFCIFSSSNIPRVVHTVYVN